MNHGGDLAASGDLFMRVIRGGDAFPAIERPADPTHREILEHAMPRRGLADEVNAWRASNARRFARGWRKLAVARLAQKYHEMPFAYGALWLTKFDRDGRAIDLGLASLRVVTTAGVTYICADIAGGGSDSNLFKFHGFGTGVAAEASGDTALGTEETTQYNPDNTRPTGSQSASTNTYTTVATYSPDSGGTRAITEHGIFTATTSGTMFDRSLFSAINVASGDSIQFTWQLTLPAGG